MRYEFFKSFQEDLDFTNDYVPRTANSKTELVEGIQKALDTYRAEFPDGDFIFDWFSYVTGGGSGYAYILSDDFVRRSNIKKYLHKGNGFVMVSDSVFNGYRENTRTKTYRDYVITRWKHKKGIYGRY